MRLTSDLSCEEKGMKCLVLYFVIFLGSIPNFCKFKEQNVVFNFVLCN